MKDLYLPLGCEEPVLILGRTVLSAVVDAILGARHPHQRFEKSYDFSKTADRPINPRSRFDKENKNKTMTSQEEITITGDALQLYDLVMQGLDRHVMAYPFPFPPLLPILKIHKDELDRIRHASTEPKTTALQVVNFLVTLFDALTKTPREYHSNLDGNSLFFKIGTFLADILNTMANGPVDPEKHYVLRARALLLGQSQSLLDRIGYDVSLPDGGHANDMVRIDIDYTKSKIFDYTKFMKYPYGPETPHWIYFDELNESEYESFPIETKVLLEFSQDNTCGIMSHDSVLETDEMFEERLRQQHDNYIRSMRRSRPTAAQLRTRTRQTPWRGYDYSFESYASAHSTRGRNAEVHNALLDSKFGLIKAICIYVTNTGDFKDIGTQTDIDPPGATKHTQTLTSSTSSSAQDTHHRVEPAKIKDAALTIQRYVRRRLIHLGLEHVHGLLREVDMHLAVLDSHVIQDCRSVYPSDKPETGKPETPKMFAAAAAAPPAISTPSSAHSSPKVTYKPSPTDVTAFHLAGEFDDEYPHSSPIIRGNDEHTHASLIIKGSDEHTLKFYTPKDEDPSFTFTFTEHALVLDDSKVKHTDDVDVDLPSPSKHRSTSSTQRAFDTECKNHFGRPPDDINEPVMPTNPFDKDVPPSNTSEPTNPFDHDVSSTSPTDAKSPPSLREHTEAPLHEHAETPLQLPAVGSYGYVYDGKPHHYTSFEGFDDDRQRYVEYAGYEADPHDDRADEPDDPEPGIEDPELTTLSDYASVPPEYADDADCASADAASLEYDDGDDDADVDAGVGSDDSRVDS